MTLENPTSADPIEERDRQWLEQVYRGDKEPDLTVRAVVAGMMFGGLMSLSNLYVGLKSGWGLGVDIAAVIVIFAVFKTLRSIGFIRRDFGMMENTMTMSVSVAASWLSSAGLVSWVPALTMLTSYQFVWWKLSLFIALILYLGLFIAIPLKRQMIQFDSLRFPANVPTGETLKAMYSHGAQAMKKAKALGAAGVLGVLVAGLRDGLGWIPSQVSLGLQIGRVSLSKLTLSLEPSLIFIGIGALFGMKVGYSMLLGLVLNYGILAPMLVNAKIIHHAAPQIRAMTPPSLPLTVAAGQTFTVMLEEATSRPELSPSAQRRRLTYTWTRPTVYQSVGEIQADLSATSLQDGSPNPFYAVLAASSVMSKAVGTNVMQIEAFSATNWEATLSIPGAATASIVKGLGFGPAAKTVAKVGGFRNISAWSLWPGATVLVVGGLLAFAFQWRTLRRTFSSMFASFSSKPGMVKGALEHLEIPTRWFIIGFAIAGTLAVIFLAGLFAIHWYMGALAVILTFFLAAITARAGAETGINPISALGKVTQLTYGALAPGNIPTNLMTAGITAGAAASCSDTIGNLKVGHMVGANPRSQFIAQFFGVFAGAILAVPAYFVLVPDASMLGGDKFPAPSALVWMGVAKVLSQGLGTLPHSALVAMIVAFLAGVIIVLIDNLFPKAKPYTPSTAALGIALTIPAYTSFSMFLGALIVWILERKAARWNDVYTIPLASGCIAGESIMGVILAALMALGVMH
jgi:uncharacterized oligopeptide transporter (OPT) family protein